MPDLSPLDSPAAVQAALDEFVRLGRTGFLARYGFAKARKVLVRDPRTGTLCDSKAIVGAAVGFQFPDAGPLRPEDFSGGEDTVVPRLQALGFEIVRIGEDWSQDEVDATVADYFEMLRAEARGEPYNKAEHNAALRQRLSGRSKSSVELKHQNISAVLDALGLPNIAGYKPRGNTQLLLRKAIQTFLLRESTLVSGIADAFEAVKAPEQRTYTAVLVEAPRVEVAPRETHVGNPVRIPRKIDFAARDEANRALGRAGEHWVLGYEQQRLVAAGLAALFGQVD